MKISCKYFHLRHFNIEQTLTHFVNTKLFKNFKNQVVTWLFSLKGLILFAVFSFFN